MLNFLPIKLLVVNKNMLLDQMRLQARSAPSGAGFGMSQTEAFGDLMMGRETAADGSKHDGYHNSIWTDGQGNYRPTDESQLQSEYQL